MVRSSLASFDCKISPSQFCEAGSSKISPISAASISLINFNDTLLICAFSHPSDISLECVHRAASGERNIIKISLDEYSYSPLSFLNYAPFPHLVAPSRPQMACLSLTLRHSDFVFPPLRGHPVPLLLVCLELSSLQRSCLISMSRGRMAVSRT